MTILYSWFIALAFAHYSSTTQNTIRTSMHILRALSFRKLDLKLLTWTKQMLFLFLNILSFKAAQNLNFNSTTPFNKTKNGSNNILHKLNLKTPTLIVNIFHKNPKDSITSVGCNVNQIKHKAFLNYDFELLKQIIIQVFVRKLRYDLSRIKYCSKA